MTGLIAKSYSALFNVVGHFLITVYKHHQFVRRAAVIGAMMATFEKSVDQAQLFWEPVCSGLGLTDKTDARYALRCYLESHAHSKSAIGIIVVNQEETFRVCIMAWNRWRKHEPVERLKTTEKRVKPL